MGASQSPGGEAPVDSEVTVRLPGGQVPAHAVLPALHAMADAVAANAAGQMRARGESVTCRAGCGACCRQHVPVSDVEARAVGELIEALPEPRRSAVRARFADAAARLQAAGLAERLLTGRPVPMPEFWEVTLGYFRLGIACPFLEDESCSVHSQRPLICREYFVTSPASECNDVGGTGIRRVLTPSLARAVCELTSDADPPEISVLPLALVPVWLARHPEPPPLRTGEAWLARFGERLKRNVGDAVTTTMSSPG
jgi:Fe-S-cluster containining protein